MGLGRHRLLFNVNPEHKLLEYAIPSVSPSLSKPKNPIIAYPLVIVCANFDPLFIKPSSDLCIVVCSPEITRTPT